MRPAGTPMKVNLVDPGALAVRMCAETYPGADQAMLRNSDDVMEIFVRHGMPEFAVIGQLLTRETSPLIGQALPNIRSGTPQNLHNLVAGLAH